MHRLLHAIKTHSGSPVAWGIWLVVATLGYFAISRVVQDFLYGQPDRPASLFPSFGPDFWQPEPLEVPLYVLGYLAIPLLAWLGFRAYQRGWLRRLAIPLLLLMVIGLIAGGLLVLSKLPDAVAAVVAYAQEHGVTKGIWLLLTKRLFAMRLLFTLVGLYLLVQLFARRQHHVPLARLDAWRGWQWFQPLFLVAVVAFLFHPNFPVEPHHYAYFLGPANDMLHGKALLYETSHLYGLLNEYALAGLFALGLPLTYASLSAVLFLAFAGFTVGWYLLLKRWLNSRALATIGVLATVAWLFLFQTSPTRSVYHFPAMTPWRFWLLLPVAWLLITHARQPKPWRRWAIISLSSLAIFWNLENGIFMSIAAWLCLGYVECKAGSSKLGAREWVRSFTQLALAWILVIAVIAAVVTGINWLIVGYPPDWGAYLREVLPFGEGIGMTPLPLVGLFELFVLTYVATLTWAASRLLRHEPVDTGALFFALFGAASLLYYIGESTWQNLYLVTPPLIALLLWVLSQLLARPPQDYTLARLATAGINAALVLVAGMLLLKVPVEFATRDYTAVATSFTRPVINDSALAADAATLRRDYATLPRLAVFHRADVPLLVELGKANALDVYYLFNLYHTYQVDVLVEQIKREQPPVLIVGTTGPIPDERLDLDDQVRYFRAHLPTGYTQTRSLQTLEVFVRH